MAGGRTGILRGLRAKRGAVLAALTALALAGEPAGASGEAMAQGAIAGVLKTLPAACASRSLADRSVLVVQITCSSPQFVVVGAEAAFAGRFGVDIVCSRGQGATPCVRLDERRGTDLDPPRQAIDVLVVF